MSGGGRGRSNIRGSDISKDAIFKTVGTLIYFIKNCWYIHIFYSKLLVHTNLLFKTVGTFMFFI